MCPRTPACHCWHAVRAESERTISGSYFCRFSASEARAAWGRVVDREFSKERVHRVTSARRADYGKGVNVSNGLTKIGAVSALER
jgi:hypothetical protein